MNDELQKKVAEAISNPKNVGEMADADSVGTVGNSECGEMLRLWVKSVSYTHLRAHETDS